MESACNHSRVVGTTKVLSPMVETMEEAEDRKWNVEMIDRIFAPQEAEEIKNIPLTRKDTEDSLFWPLENDGRYSCKTGYQFLKEDEVGHQVTV